MEGCQDRQKLNKIKLTARDRHTVTNILVISYNSTTQLAKYDTNTVRHHVAVFKLHSSSKFLKYSTPKRKKIIASEKLDK